MAIGRTFAQAFAKALALARLDDAPRLGPGASDEELLGRAGPSRRPTAMRRSWRAGSAGAPPLSDRLRGGSFGPPRSSPQTGARPAGVGCRPTSTPIHPERTRISDPWFLHELGRARRRPRRALRGRASSFFSSRWTPAPRSSPRAPPTTTPGLGRPGPTGPRHEVRPATGGRDRLGRPRAAGERPSVVILGAGPNRIGQGIEFDYLLRARRGWAVCASPAATR